MNDGGPAFPRTGHHVPEADFPIGMADDAQQGMTMRQWYKGQALKGLLACGPHDCDEAGLAHDAGRYADAMLAEDAREVTP